MSEVFDTEPLAVDLPRHVFEHVLPLMEWDRHDQGEMGCRCEPDAVVRVRDGSLVATEFVHHPLDP